MTANHKKFLPKNLTPPRSSVMQPTKFSPRETQVLASMLDEFAAANAEDRKALIAHAHRKTMEVRPDTEEYPLAEAQHRDVSLPI